MFVGSRLDAYKKELEDYKSDLLDYKNLAITGIYKVGSRSMVSALFENISNLFDLAIIDDNFLTID
mgnify:FL=1